MSELLHFEFRRLFRRVSFYVCTGIVILSSVFIMYFFYSVSIVAGGYAKSPDFILQTIFPISNLPTFVIIFISIFGCEDYAKGTAKTIFSLGYPRWKIFTAKFITSSTASTIMYCALLLLTILLSNNSDTKVDTNYLLGPYENTDPFYLIVLQQFTSILAINTFIFLISEIVSKTGISIIIGIFAPGKVLFGAPERNAELDLLHNACERNPAQQRLWTPHVTLLIDESSTICKALPVVLKSFKPFVGQIIRLHLCAFWPTREILSIELKRD